MNFEIFTADQRPDLQVPMDKLAGHWKPFMLQEQYSLQYWEQLKHLFPDCQYAFVDTETGEIAARGLSVPIAWDGSIEDLPAGWGVAHKFAFEQHEAGQAPNTLCALEITLKPDLRGHGLSARMIEAMKAIARTHGFGNLIAPVRPSRKSEYPLIPIDTYLQWTNAPASNEPFDPWIRIHKRLGAEILTVANQSMIIEGTVAQWEQWTNMKLPSTGNYIVDGALTPVYIDVEANRGLYIEPNVWMRHPIDT